jgi:hypothetical protein
MALWTFSCSWQIQVVLDKEQEIAKQALKEGNKVHLTGARSTCLG